MGRPPGLPLRNAVNTIRSRNGRLPVSIAAASLVVLLAAIAALNLWLALRTRQRGIELASDVSIIERGRSLARSLAAHPVMSSAPMDAAACEQASALLDALAAVEGDVFSLALEENGALLFYARPPEDTDTAAKNSSDEFDHVRIGARPLNAEVAGGPGLAFSLNIPSASGGERNIEVVLRRGVRDEWRQRAARAVEEFFRLSMVVFLGAALACVALVLGVIRYDRSRSDGLRRREQLVLAGAMSAGILHDFRNPLSALQLDAQMLGKELDKGDSADIGRAATLATRLQDVLKRLSALLGEGMAMAMPETERGEASLMDVRQCLLDGIALARPRFESAGVVLESSVPTAPVTSWGRTSLLTRAILNLLINAQQHSSRGASVFVRMQVRGGRVEIEIEDQGPGIPKRDRRRVFDLYVSRRQGGAGLGLFLARAAVEDCGGTLKLRKSEQGASLLLSLPVMAAPGPGARDQGES